MVRFAYAYPNYSKVIYCDCLSSPQTMQIYVLYRSFIISFLPINLSAFKMILCRLKDFLMSFINQWTGIWIGTSGTEWCNRQIIKLKCILFVIPKHAL